MSGPTLLDGSPDAAQRQCFSGLRANQSFEQFVERRLGTPRCALKPHSIGAIAMRIAPATRIEPKFATTPADIRRCDSLRRASRSSA